MKHTNILLFALISMTGCLLGEDSDPDAPCADDEIRFEDANGDVFCEEEPPEGLEAVVNTGYDYVGYRLGYRTYMLETCAFSSNTSCKGYQTGYSYSHMNAGAKCYNLLKRSVSRSPTGGHSARTNWSKTYVVDCRR